MAALANASRALHALEDLVSATGFERLLTGIKAVSEPLDMVVKWEYNEANDTVDVGYYQETGVGEAEYVEFRIDVAAWVQRHFTEQCQLVLRDLEVAVVKAPEEAGRAAMPLLTQVGRINEVWGENLFRGRYPAVDDVLRHLEENVQGILLRGEAIPASARTGGTDGGRPTGRPLDPTAPQEEIERLVWDYAAQPRYQHRDGPRKGQPKPTTIRDVLFREHPDVCGSLGDRTLFDRVKRALRDWTPPENVEES